MSHREPKRHTGHIFFVTPDFRGGWILKTPLLDNFWPLTTQYRMVLYSKSLRLPEYSAFCCRLILLMLLYNVHAPLSHIHRYKPVITFPWPSSMHQLILSQSHFDKILLFSDNLLTLALLSFFHNTVNFLTCRCQVFYILECRVLFRVRIIEEKTK